MADINLAPGSQVLAAARRRRQSVYAVSVLILLVTAVAAGSIIYLQGQSANELQTIKQEIATRERTLSARQDDIDRVAAFERRLAGAENLLSAHRSWEELFSAGLEALLPGATVVDVINVSQEDDKVVIKGRTTAFDIVTETIASLRDRASRPTPFSHVTVNTISQDSGAISPDNPDAVTIPDSFNFVAELTLK